MALLLPGCNLMKGNLREPGVKGSNRWSMFKTMMRATGIAWVHSPRPTAQMGMTMTGERIYAFGRGNLGFSPSARRIHSPQPGTEAFEQWLDEQKYPRRTSGSLDLMVDGQRFFPIYMNALRAAKTSIDLQTFIFDNDDFAVEMADLLKEKSQSISVRVLYDDLGSTTAWGREPETKPRPGFQAPEDMLAYLTQNSKVRARNMFNPWLIVDHAKLHVIDGHTAFMGGMNIGREYASEWHDMMFKLEGPIVAELRTIYEKDWKHQAWQSHWLPFWREKQKPSAVADTSATGRLVPLRILETSSLQEQHQIYRASIAAIKASKQRVWIETPYFSSDQIEDELKAAARRGVDVRLIVPTKNDSPTLGENNLTSAGRLIEAGAKVYTYPGMTHLKLLIADGWVSAGSSNYDTLSLRINRELNVASSDPQTVKLFATRIFEPDFKHSHQLTKAETDAKSKAFSEAVADQL